MKEDSMHFNYARQLFENSLDDLVLYLKKQNIDIRVNNDSTENKIKECHIYTITITKRKK